MSKIVDKAESRAAGETALKAKCHTARDCENCKRKRRGGEEYRSLVNRLSRIEGQVRGLKSMVENDGYCTDILVQVSAAQAALSAFAKELLGAHIRTCVAEGIRGGDDAVVDELIVTVQKLMR